jgi:hypothetical protein
LIHRGYRTNCAAMQHAEFQRRLLALVDLLLKDLPVREQERRIRRALQRLEIALCPASTRSNSCGGGSPAGSI